MILCVCVGERVGVYTYLCLWYQSAVLFAKRTDLGYFWSSILKLSIHGLKIKTKDTAAYSLKATNKKPQTVDNVIE